MDRTLVFITIIRSVNQSITGIKVDYITDDDNQVESFMGMFSRCKKHGWTKERGKQRGKGTEQKVCKGRTKFKEKRGRGRSKMQFFRSALFPATGEPPVLVSATFKFVPLSALFAEKCLFNFVYRHCKIFTRSLLLEQFSHHRGRWELDDAGIRRG